MTDPITTLLTISESITFDILNCLVVDVINHGFNHSFPVDTLIAEVNHSPSQIFEEIHRLVNLGIIHRQKRDCKDEIKNIILEPQSKITWFLLKFHFPENNNEQIAEFLALREIETLRKKEQAYQFQSTYLGTLISMLTDHKNG